MNLNTSLPALLIVVMLSLAACNKQSDTIKEPVRITFKFVHQVETSTLEFDKFSYQNDAGNLYSVATLKYFVTDFRLTTTDGREEFFDTAHYVDGRDETTLSFSPEKKIAADTYYHLSFTFGIDSSKNVPGLFPDPPESNMEWPLAMGSGYHYMKLEGKFDSAGLIKNYQAHTGPTMGVPYDIDIEFDDIQLVADSDDVAVEIIMDINKWWNGPNTFDLNIMTSVMGNPQIQKQLKENGQQVFSFRKPE